MCGETFQNNQQLEVHTRTHEETNFLCTSCNIHFKTYIELFNHVEPEHETNLSMSFPDNNDNPVNDSSSEEVTLWHNHLTCFSVSIRHSCYSWLTFPFSKKIQNEKC